MRKVREFFLRGEAWVAGLVALLFAGGAIMAAAATAPPLVPVPLLEQLTGRYGSDARVRLLTWQILVREEASALERRRLLRINEFVNRTPFVEDRDHWQQEDYWATPVQFLASNGGDCEDYAITKLFSLQSAQINPDKLRLMYVTAKSLNQPHMVLLYRANPGAHPLVLDNLNSEVTAARDRTDLVPVYSFNASGLWLNRSGSHEIQEVKVRNRPGSSRWDELLVRIDNEGVFR